MAQPSMFTGGAAAKVSTLVWDTDLVIPDGRAIDSESGEVGIIGDVAISGNTSVEGYLQALSLQKIAPLSLVQSGARKAHPGSYNVSGMTPIQLNFDRQDGTIDNSVFAWSAPCTFSFTNKTGGGSQIKFTFRLVYADGVVLEYTDTTYNQPVTYTIPTNRSKVVILSATIQKIFGDGNTLEVTSTPTPNAFVPTFGNMVAGI